jgi:histone demethylase JARID1
MSVTVVSFFQTVSFILPYNWAFSLGFHMDCLDPPIATIPADNWFCFNCLSSSGGDYGFDEGEEHSLSSFHARDLEFRRMWFGSHFSNLNKHESLPPHMCNELAGVRYTEYDVEEEFWRLVQSQEETVEIEYGADVHSSTHGRFDRFLQFLSHLNCFVVRCPL